MVGDHENSDSPYGTFDQGGNVMEWTEGRYVNVNSDRVMRGGAATTSAADLLASHLGIVGVPSLEVVNAGFRISEVPEPATMSLLAVGGLAMMARRRG